VVDSHQPNEGGEAEIKPDSEYLDKPAGQTRFSCRCFIDNFSPSHQTSGAVRSVLNIEFANSHSFLFNSLPVFKSHFQPAWVTRG
jgi:hypothetical protein